MWSDDRALANSLIQYGMIVLVGALLYIVLNQPFQDLMGNVNTNVASISTGHAYVNAGWTWMPLFILLLAAVYIIGSAVVESQGPPR